MNFEIVPILEGLEGKFLFDWTKIKILDHNIAAIPFEQVDQMIEFFVSNYLYFQLNQIKTKAIERVLLIWKPIGETII